ncbi:hypothetical protein FALCPG4_011711 [Fusarium falciforme]
MTSEQPDAYAVIFRVDEITEQFRADQVVSTNRLWSPSPPPEHDSTGKRMNSREQPYSRCIDEERNQLVETTMRTIPA